MRPRIQQARTLGTDHRRWQTIHWPPPLENFILAGLGPTAPGLIPAFDRTLAKAEVVLAAYAPLGLASQAIEKAMCRKKPVALIPLFHADDPLNSLPRWVSHYRQADAILALTESEARIFREHFEHPNVHVIGAGVDLAEMLQPEVSGSRFRERNRLGDAPIALFLGRKEAGKNYRMAVEAVQIARVQNSALRDLKLVLIGGDVDQRPVSAEEGLYLGPLSRQEALDALDACDVLINPSTSESFGLTILEAWARRKPVIANAACGPFHSIITHDHNGWLETDADGMARRIVQLLQKPSLALAMGSAGHQTLMDQHLWSHVARRTLDALESIRRAASASAR